MADTDSLEALQGLHRDLLALTNSRFSAVDRLWSELEGRVEEFRKLLEKPGKNDTSRQALNSGSLKLDDSEYSINEEFKQEAIQIADELELDEMEAARLLLNSQRDAQELDRSPQVSAIIRFHSQRTFLLGCLQWTLYQSQNDDLEDTYRESLRLFVQERVLQITDGRADGGSKFFQKCVVAMEKIENWLQNLAMRLQRAIEARQNPSMEFFEVMEYQRTAMTQQHESLAAIATHLIKSDYTSAVDLRFLIQRAKKVQRHDTILVHYVPVTMALIAQLGSQDSKCTLADARDLHNHLKDAEGWSLRNFHAAILACWLGEYSGRYIEDPRGSPVQGANLAKEAEERAKLFSDSLKDGAFHLLLSICKDIRQNEWYEPAKVELITLLLQDTPVLPPDAVSISDQFQALIADEIQSFAEAFITNMPDSLRKLKAEEDEQRRNLPFHLQRGAPQYEMHLERFLVIISLGFESCPNAAHDFWEDPEGNLFGFLQWAAKRQSTPRVAAFCEMLRSISEDEKCADSAHAFLIEEGASSSGRLRRTGSLGWNQIFAELQFYADSTRERPATTQKSTFESAHVLTEQDEEPESFVMLECYLRLAAHVLRQSRKARDWILNHPTFKLWEVLLKLSGNTVTSGVRACAFTAIAALLTEKDQSLALMWDILDQWIYKEKFKTELIGRPVQPHATPLRNEDAVFETISLTYAESDAFLRLLNALVAPYAGGVGLHDALPFAETLGSTYRAPGIEPYVDLVMSKVVAQRVPEIGQLQQHRLLGLDSLQFIVTCLATFNEDLVVIANKSNIPVDAAIQASSLSSYVRLHPFARVMEWLFNEKVLKSLFTLAHADINEVSKAKPDSPLVLLLIKSIEVITLVMKLQATYLDVVRPLVKLQAPQRRDTVANPALASFEDAIITKMDIISDLGLYCGAGHQDLAIVSLALLEKLSSSRKLVASPHAGFGQRSDRSKIIGVLEKDDDHERIARSFISELQVDFREVEAGPESPGYVVKLGILSFLNSCLAALPNRPTVAHLLLGFSCGSNTISISDDSLFAAGASLFHAVLTLAVEYPAALDGSYNPWLSVVRQSANEVLRKLWAAPLSSSMVLAELREAEFLSVQALKQIPINSDIMFDGLAINDPDFILNPSAVAYRNWLQERQIFFDYAARELRIVAKDSLPTFTARLQAVLFGVTTRPDGTQIRNASIFDLFDFVDQDFSRDIPTPSINLLGKVDLSLCKISGPNGISLFDLKRTEELLSLRRNELIGQNSTPGAVVETDFFRQIDTEINHLCVYLNGVNQRTEIDDAQDKALESWVRVMTVLVESGQFDDSGIKTAFILQAVQSILPKLERSFNDNLSASLQLAGFARMLLQNLDFKERSLERSKTGDYTNDRLFQLFRVSLNGIFSVNSNIDLREILYQICFRYLHGMAATSGKGSTQARHNIRVIKATGDRFVNTICDDAYAGRGTCKISALLLLNALVALAKQEDSKFLIDSFNRLNFIGLLVDSIRHIPVELRETKATDVPLLLSSYDASLSLLLRLAQTRLGATYVANAGLFAAARDSQIFAADPDIGLEMENADALKKFFDLMLAVVRIISAVVLSRGAQNERTTHDVRDFLQENRQSVVSVFKRNAGIGGRDGVQTEGEVLNELVDQFTLLMSVADFLEFEDKTLSRKARPAVFS